MTTLTTIHNQDGDIIAVVINETRYSPEALALLAGRVQQAEREICRLRQILDQLGIDDEEAHP